MRATVSRHVDRHHRRPHRPGRHRLGLPRQAGLPGRRPRPARGARRDAPRLLERPLRPRLAGPARPRGSTAAPATACPSWSWWSRSWAGPSPRARSCPTVIASAVLVAAAPDGARRAAAARPGQRLTPPAPSRSAATSSCATAWRPARPAWCSAAVWPTSCSWRPATTSRSSTSELAGATVDVPANLDPTRRAARVTLDGAAAEVIPGARQVLVDLARTILSAEATGIALRVHAAGQRVREGPRAVRSGHRHLPGRQAPLRQHAGRDRAGHRRRVGRGPGRVGRRRRSSRPPPRPPPRWPSRPPTSAPSSTSRCTAASASRGSTTPTCTCAGPPRSRPSSTPRPRASQVDRPRPSGREARVARSTCRPRPRPWPTTVRDVRRSASARSTPTAQRDALIDSGYVMPHWPKPWGRDAGAVEQLVIEQEFSAAASPARATASPAGSSSR